MARSLHRLTALKVTRTLSRGLYADGGGLYLQVARNGSRSWLYRFRLNGKTRHMGLGSLNVVSLADARTAAFECRRLCQAGTDPISQRDSSLAEARLTAARTMTFDQCAESYIEAHRSGWRNAKHAAQWRNTLKTYAGPALGSLPVQMVDVPAVLKVLEPIWSTKPETASRLRGRIEAVLNWATSRGLRQGENPARWKGHLEMLLPRISKVRKVKHHAALPYEKIADFIKSLRNQPGIAARALEFAILTGGRTAEVIGANWSEVNLDESIWTIPGIRMKGGKEHRVPLSRQATSILNQMLEARRGDFIFTGFKKKRPLSNMAMLVLLRRMGWAKVITVHGFRTTFRVWADERTSFPSDAAELAIAHTISNKVQAAYRRTDMLDKRRRLMQAWADYLDKLREAGKVISLRRKNS
jgi:integrase